MTPLLLLLHRAPVRQKLTNKLVVTCVANQVDMTSCVVCYKVVLTPPRVFFGIDLARCALIMSIALHPCTSLRPRRCFAAASLLLKIEQRRITATPQYLDDTCFKTDQRYLICT